MSEKTSPPVHVLVVDDEPLIRWSLCERLATAGFHAHAAGDGRSALDCLQGGHAPIQLAVLDLKLPDTDGLTLVGRIRELSPRCHVILMTAFGTAEDLRRAATLGVDGVITKPFDLDLMLQTIEATLEPDARPAPGPIAGH